MLSLTDVALTYPDGTAALAGVTLDIPLGIFGLLGPNGAGKSSLMRVVATLQRPTRGAVRFGELDVLTQPRRLRAQLGYLPQDFGVPPGASAAALMDQLAVLKGLADRAARAAEIERRLRQVRLWEERARAVSDYSGGMRQRFGVAQALLGHPRLLIVDEPTAGLDPEERHALYDLLGAIGEEAVVILSTHLIEDVRSLCDRLAVLAGGRLRFAGSPEQLVAPLAGRLWQSEAPPSAGTLLSRRLERGRALHRTLAEQAPAAGAERAEPVLEDGYLAVLGEGA